MDHQVETIKQILTKNKTVMGILDKTLSLNISNWYLGSGCISQTIWNYKHGYDLNHGINDYDLVYFDDSDLSYEAEDKVIKMGRVIFDNLPVEIRNQARVHLWYKDHFGYDIEPHTSTEDAINTWPTTATAIGIQGNQNNFKIYAPYGLDDLINLIVRPNKKKITEEIYNKKVERWSKAWPLLTIIPW